MRLRGSGVGLPFVRVSRNLIERNGYAKYSRYRLVRYRIRREIGYNVVLSVCMCVCMSVENRLEREIVYSADFFQSQVPCTKRYPVYIVNVVSDNL